MKKRKLYLAAAIAAAVALASGCGEKSSAPGAETARNPQITESQAQKKVIKVAYLPITHALAGFEAYEQEKLKKETGLEIELVRFGSWTELMDALNTGRVDAAFALAELVMKAREQGIDVYLGALAHRDGNVVVVGKDIRNPEDLKGKTFAIPHRQSSHYLLLNDALAKEGLSIDDVKVVELAPPEMPAALASGQIAGYCVAEPFGAKSVSLNFGRVLYDSKDLWPDSICCGLAFSGKFLKEHPELAASLADAVKEAGISLDHDHDRALKLAGEYFRMSKDALEVSLKWISYSNLDITREQYETLREKVTKYGLSQNPPKYEDLVKNVR